MRQLTMIRENPRRRGRVLAGVAVLGAVVLAAVLGTAGAAQSVDDPARTATIMLSSPDGNGVLRVWRNISTGRLTLSVTGTGTYDVLTGTTLQTVDEGIVSTVDTYQTTDDAWTDLSAVYGVTLAAVNSELASGTTTAEPTATSASVAALTTTNPDGSVDYSEPYMTNTHYGDAADHHLARLETDIGFGIPKVYSLDGYQLIDSATTDQYGPDRNTSGTVASLWYAPAGSSDSVLTVNLAKPHSGAGDWGSTYQSLLTSADLVGPNYSATKVGDNQVVFARGSTYVSITATWTPSNAEWATLIAPFAA